jgi:hypothetical protein
MKYAVLILAALLCACGGSTVVENRPEVVKVPVTVPCVAGERPAMVEPLKSAHPDWHGYTPKQKAEYAAAQALRHQSYGQELNAATGACR